VKFYKLQQALSSVFTDNQPGKAGHAEEKGDGEQYVGDEAQDHIRPVDLNKEKSELKALCYENFQG
jgi:hypothetical protein